MIRRMRTTRNGSTTVRVREKVLDIKNTSFYDKTEPFNRVKGDIAGACVEDDEEEQ